MEAIIQGLGIRVDWKTATFLRNAPKETIMSGDFLVVEPSRIISLT